MSKETQHGEEGLQNQGRRQFLGTAAMLGAAGAGLSVGLAPTASAATGQTGPDFSKIEVHPGQLDEYYSFSSGGHSGDVRVFGFPSGRIFKSIPVFNQDVLVGWGKTNESKAIIGTKKDGSLKYDCGDTHHVHQSYTDGTYNGKYAFVNDKINSRIARIKLDTMECDKITEIPNIQGFHGIFPDKRDPVNEKINHTTRVFCGSEFRQPLPNNGRDLYDGQKYGSLFTCVDAETMQVRYQIRVDGNCDLIATSYDGKLAATN